MVAELAGCYDLSKRPKIVQNGLKMFENQGRCIFETRFQQNF